VFLFLFPLHINGRINKDGQGWTTRKVLQLAEWMDDQSLYVKSGASNAKLRRVYLVFGRSRVHISVKTPFTVTDLSWFFSVIPGKTEIEGLPETGSGQLLTRDFVF